MGWAVQIAATFIATILILFLGYVIVVAFIRAFPNLRFKIKYNLLGKKYTDEDISFLMENLENNVSDYDLLRVMLVDTKNLRSFKKAKEMIYIYNNMKKGGEEHGRRFKKINDKIKKR